MSKLESLILEFLDGPVWLVRTSMTFVYVAGWILAHSLNDWLVRRRFGQDSAEHDTWRD